MVGAGASRAGLAADDAVSRLAGRWAGQGTVTSTRGPTESFKCVVNYLPGNERSQGGVFLIFAPRRADGFAERRDLLRQIGR